MLQTATQPSGGTLSEIKSVSAVKKYPRAKPKRGGGTIIWKRLKSLDDEVFEAGRISREVVSEIGWLLLHKHITPLQAEAARRYAYIMARFDKYSVEGRRTAKSPSYERAFGSDQELERLRNMPDGIVEYERRARKARKDYNKLQKVLSAFSDRMTGRNAAKSVLDDLCCSDVPVAPEYRQNVAVVLAAVAETFGVTVQPRRQQRRRG